MIVDVTESAAIEAALRETAAEKEVWLWLFWHYAGLISIFTGSEGILPTEIYVPVEHVSRS